MSLGPGIFEQLRTSLHKLALPAVDQLQVLRADDGAPIDELALEFDDVARAVVLSGWLTAEGAAVVRRLDDHLKSMSGRKNAHLWTKVSLLSAPEWHETRRLAEQALRLMSTSQGQ